MTEIVEAIFLLFALSVSVPVLTRQEQFLQDPTPSRLFLRQIYSKEVNPGDVCHSLATYSGKASFF